MRNVSSQPRPTWLVIQQIGPLVAHDHDPDTAHIDTIVMAERDTEAAANLERDRRNALANVATGNPGSYFVMSSDEAADCPST